MSATVEIDSLRRADCGSAFEVFGWKIPTLVMSDVSDDGAVDYLRANLAEANQIIDHSHICELLQHAGSGVEKSSQ